MENCDIVINVKGLVVLGIGLNTKVFVSSNRIKAATFIFLVIALHT